MEFKRLKAPFASEDVAALRAGEFVSVSGTLYTGRDAAHKRLTDAIKSGQPLPIPLEGQGIYYVGPCIKDGNPVSAGPTTSARMDVYAPALYDRGIKVTIGKGDRTQNVYQSIQKKRSSKSCRDRRSGGAVFRLYQVRARCGVRRFGHGGNILSKRARFSVDRCH